MAQIISPPQMTPNAGVAKAPQPASPDNKELPQTLVDTMQAIFGKHQGYRTSKNSL